MFSIRSFGEAHSIDEESFGQGDELKEVRKKLLSFRDFSEVVNGGKGNWFLSIWVPSLGSEVFASFSLEKNEYSFDFASCTVACNSCEKGLKWLPWWLCRRWGLIIHRIGIYFNGYIKKQGDGEIEWNESCYAGLLDEVLYERGLRAEEKREEALKMKKETEAEKAKEELKEIFEDAEGEVECFYKRILALNSAEIY